MSQTEMKMPKMGESVAEATIIKWLKNEGDHIEAEEPVLEIATDKVDSEVPAPVAGKLIKRMFNEGDVVQVGSIIALIGDASTTSVTPAATTAPAPVAAAPVVANAVINAPQIATAAVTSSADRFYSPLVRSIAAEEKISQQELDAISGTGTDNRVTKKDILAYVAQKKIGCTTTRGGYNNTNT
jgi:2-oxoglutarate dehydrogenase E2 component (dihydrolipoamide succinyltransferase)